MKTAGECCVIDTGEAVSLLTAKNSLNTAVAMGLLVCECGWVRLEDGRFDADGHELLAAVGGGKPSSTTSSSASNELRLPTPLSEWTGAGSVCSEFAQ